MDAASHLTSVDIDAGLQSVAREELAEDRRLTLVTGDALAFLECQKPHSFDLVFADAMAGKYEGLRDALRVVAPGGFYVIDDMIPEPKWPAGHDVKAQALPKELASQTDFGITQMAWASGLILAVRKAA